MKFEIFNRTDEASHVILEPIGDSFEIPSGLIGEIELENDLIIRFDLYSDNRINIWTEGHVTVTIGDSKMEFSALT